MQIKLCEAPTVGGGREGSLVSLAETYLLLLLSDATRLLCTHTQTLTQTLTHTECTRAAPSTVPQFLLTDGNRSRVAANGVKKLLKFSSAFWPQNLIRFRRQAPKTLCLSSHLEQAGVQDEPQAT